MARLQQTEAPLSSAPSRENRIAAIDAAIIAIGAFLLGVVVTRLPLDDPRWYARAGTWLMAIPALVAAILLGRHRWGSRRVRRTMQLALVASVLIHALLVFAAVHVVIFARRVPDASPVRQRPALDRLEKLPEYAVERRPLGEDPRRDFERPLETIVPESNAASSARTPAGRKEPPVEMPLPRVVESKPTVAAREIRRREIAEAPPASDERRPRWRRRAAVGSLSADRAVAIPPAPSVLDSPAPAAEAAPTGGIIHRAAPPSVSPRLASATPAPSAPLEVVPAGTTRREAAPRWADELTGAAAGRRLPVLRRVAPAVFSIPADSVAASIPEAAGNRLAEGAGRDGLSPRPTSALGLWRSRLETRPAPPALSRVGVEAAGHRPQDPAGRLAIGAALPRRASPRDAEDTGPGEFRWARRETAASPRGDGAIVIAADSYRRRELRLLGGDPLGGAPAPGPETEEAIERGLAFLARTQTPAGGWTLAGSEEPPSLASDTAATGLSLLAFLGAGYHHRAHKYAENVAAGIGYLLQHQKEDGDLYQPMDETSNQSVWLYSHSIAALALCEAYGMTQDPSLQQPAQRALDFIAQSQQALRGGWRYRPNYGSDTSVTGWMTLALRSGDLANLETPAGTYEGIRHWLDLAQASADQPHLYCYNPFAPDTPTQGHGRRPSKTMTAVGLLMRLYSGSRRDEEAMIRGAEFLRDNPPSLGGPSDPQRDTYYWYYATQVMRHMGGPYWRDWDRALHPLLAGSQTREGPWAGSWDPDHPMPDRWAAHAGRLYVTTMNLLSLEVAYRLLPLYVDAAGEAREGVME